MVRILVDADACPVKDEIYAAAYRLKIPVLLVANSYIRHPDHPLISMKMVSDGFDAADDYIADNAGPGSLIVTSDILLAERGLQAGAVVLDPKGATFTGDNIGTAIATRAIMADLRAGLPQGGGPPPFTNRDRSNFANTLDRNLTRLIRTHSHS